VSLPTELLSAAAAAIAGTMGTDLYQYARQRLVDLWRRRRGEQVEGEAELLARLDTLQQAVVALDPDQRQPMLKGIQASLTNILASSVEADQADALRDLIASLRSRIPHGSLIAEQKVEGNIAFGDINTAGRDNIIGGLR